MLVLNEHNKKKLNENSMSSHSVGSCEEEVESTSDGAAELGIGNVGGVFVVLALGCSCASVVGIVEFLWNVKDLAIEEKVR